MKRSFALFFFNILVTLCLSAQNEFEFMGVLRIGEDAFISYRIEFVENDGLIEGYSLTDMGGEHETKSYLTGYFDDEKNVLEFYESGILYTKSFITQNDFCFVHFNGTLKRLNERQNIEGLFKGLYSDGKECISGELKLTNVGRILKRAKKIDRKVERNILIPKEKKEKVHLVRDMDSLRTNRLNKNETLSVFSKSDRVVLTLYDAGQEDGDKVSLRLNGTLVHPSIEATAVKQRIEIPLEQTQTTLEIKALNNGSIGGNTVMLELEDSDHTLETVTNLKMGESAKFVFYTNQ